MNSHESNNENPKVQSQSSFDAQHWKQQLEMLESEYKEYKSYCQSIESELQHQVDSLESELKRTQRKVEYMQDEKIRLSENMSRLNKESDDRLKKFEFELENIKEINTKQKSHILSLEQVNDKLERDNRSLSAQLTDKDIAYDELLERNALLEVHLEDQTNRAHVEIRRLRDELRSANKSLIINEMPNEPSAHHHLDSMIASETCVKTSNKSLRKTSEPYNEKSTSGIATFSKNQQANTQFLLQSASTGTRNTDVPFSSSSAPRSASSAALHSNRFLTYLIDKIDILDKELIKCCRKSSISPSSP